MSGGSGSSASAARRARRGLHCLGATGGAGRSAIHGSRRDLAAISQTQRIIGASREDLEIRPRSVAARVRRVGNRCIRRRDFRVAPLRRTRVERHPRAPAIRTPVTIAVDQTRRGRRRRPCDAAPIAGVDAGGTRARDAGDRARATGGGPATGAVDGGGNVGSNTGRGAFTGVGSSSTSSTSRRGTPRGGVSSASQKPSRASSSGQRDSDVGTSSDTLVSSAPPHESLRRRRHHRPRGPGRRLRSR